MRAGTRLTKPGSKQACKANSSEFGLNVCGARHFPALFNLELLIPQFRPQLPLLPLPPASTLTHSYPSHSKIRIKGLKRGEKYGMIKISIFILLHIYLEGSIRYETEHRSD